MDNGQYLVMVLLVGVGGFIGAILRFVISGAATTDRFPYGTLYVNIIGSFILGYIVFSYAFNGAFTTEWRVFLGIGILGAFTTMSTFSVETMSLLETSENIKAASNMFLNIGGCVGAVWLGRAAVIVFQR